MKQEGDGGHVHNCLLFIALSGHICLTCISQHQENIARNLRKPLHTHIEIKVKS